MQPENPWDARYSDSEYVYGVEPNDFLAAQYAKIPGKNVLCLGEGEGRNAVFLATSGFTVTAVDSSAVGLAKAEKLAQANNVSIRLIQADLATFELGENQWDAIISVFCHLPSAIRKHLHAKIAPALKRGGIFILEAYRPPQLQLRTGGPTDPDMLMSAENLKQELTGLEFEFANEIERNVVEGKFHTGKGAVLQAVALKAVRTYQVSVNREAGVHKMRFIERGGGALDGECTMCKPSAEPRE